MEKEIMNDENKEHTIKKTSRTIFPFGFGVKKTEDSIIVLDFVDQIDGENYEIISSFAMSETSAKSLIDAIAKAINEEGGKENAECDGNPDR